MPFLPVFILLVTVVSDDIDQCGNLDGVGASRVCTEQPLWLLQTHATRLPGAISDRHTPLEKAVALVNKSAKALKNEETERSEARRRPSQKKTVHQKNLSKEDSASYEDLADCLARYALAEFEVQVPLVEIELTIQAALAVAALVNETAGDVVDTVAGAADDVSALLENLKSAVEAMKVLIGADAGNAMVSLFGQLAGIAGPMADKLKEDEVQLLIELSHTEGSLENERAKLLSSFQASVNSVSALRNAASGNTSTLALLGEGLFQASALPGWFPPWLGGKRTPCEEAKGEVDATNRTVQQLHAMLLSLNSSAVDDELGEMLSQLDISVSTARAALSMAIDGLSQTGLPESTLVGARTGIEGVFTVVGPLRKKLLKSQVDAMLQIDEARADAVALDCAVQALEIAREKVCVSDS